MFGLVPLCVEAAGWLPVQHALAGTAATGRLKLPQDGAVKRRDDLEKLFHFISAWQTVEICFLGNTSNYWAT